MKSSASFLTQSEVGLGFFFKRFSIRWFIFTKVVLNSSSEIWYLLQNDEITLLPLSDFLAKQQTILKWETRSCNYLSGAETILNKHKGFIKLDVRSTQGCNYLLLLQCLLYKTHVTGLHPAYHHQNLLRCNMQYKVLAL